MSVRMRENTDQKNYVFGHFSRSSDFKHFIPRVSAFLWNLRISLQLHFAGYCYLALFIYFDFVRVLLVILPFITNLFIY